MLKRDLRLACSFCDCYSSIDIVDCLDGVIIKSTGSSHLLTKLSGLDHHQVYWIVASGSSYPLTGLLDGNIIESSGSSYPLVDMFGWNRDA